VLRETLAAGPGRFLQRVKVLPYRDSGRFVGYQIIRLFPGEGIPMTKVRIGDVVLHANGRAIQTPDDFMALWNELSSAEALELDLLREGQPVSVRIEFYEVSGEEAAAP
jgi:type II secretory pathway component PulC